MVSYNSGPLVAHRGRTWAPAHGNGNPMSNGKQHQPVRRNMLLSRLPNPIPLFPVMGRKRTECTSCRRTGHNGKP